ncbi:MAG: hypothetical protein B7733_13595 [Myxococcales bacterium FL481]|nr:MAG: hypothetical protein B7733_13595 [Myxococcales bacterium FL481]
MPDAEFSYIWICNDANDTVSKVDTRTLVEHARYIAGGTDPSRTSISLNGDAAVASRGMGWGTAGIAKFLTRQSHCEENDYNGDGELTTSSGKDDVLPFGEDDCLQWFVEFDGALSNRPVAWTTGVQGADGYWNDAKLWTSYTVGSDHKVALLNGDTGEIEDEVSISLTEYAYGAAVDEDNDLWVMNRNRSLIQIDFDTLEVETHTVPGGSPYGIAVARDQSVWVTTDSYSTFRFDPQTEQFDAVEDARGLGVMVDVDNRVWIAGTYSGANANNLIGVNGDTLEIIGFYDFGSSETRGISIDFDGFVWMVNRADTAYKFDPEAEELAGTYTGLDNPYTYSDMTGYGLGAANPDIPIE